MVPEKQSNMMKKLLLLILAMMAMMSTRADVVTPDQALVVARSFISQGNARFTAGPGIALKLAHQANSRDGNPDYYVFNNGADGGYIVVSGDDRTVPVWGYSTSGTFDYASLPDNAKWWLSEYQRQLEYLRTHPDAHPRQSITLSRSVDALMKSKWDQFAPYNIYCPEAQNNTVFLDKYLGKACTGCVATALSQIMYYHKWPLTGQGSTNYTFDLEEYQPQATGFVERDRKVSLSADFSRSAYRWNAMKNEYKTVIDGNNYTCYYMADNGYWVEDNLSSSISPGTAVAKLMSDVGIAVKMTYGALGRGGSGSNIEKAKTAMETYFQYSADLHWRDDVESTYVVGGRWDQSLREELDAGRPIYYRGETEEYGHAFVLDGYDNDGRFHVNWGWSGDYSDVYYYSSLLNPGSDAFKTEQGALFLTPMNGSTGGDVVKTLSVAMPKGNAGKVMQGGTIARIPFTVYGGNLDQEVTFTLSGRDAGQFSLSRSSVSASAANGGVTSNVTYKPTTLGNHTAQLTVSSGSDVDPVVLSLKGSAVAYYDANGDQIINVADLTAMIQALLNNENVAYTDQSINIADVTELIGALATGSTAMDIDDGLVAYYPFDGDARDMSGHGNDGIVNNVTLTTGTYGEADGAYQFGGYYNPGYIRIPNSESLKFTNGFSFACFVKPTAWYGHDTNQNFVATNGVQAIFAKSSDQNGPALQFAGDPSKIKFYSNSLEQSTQWCGLHSQDKIQGNKLNTWVHVAVTYSDQEARMYIDGALVSQKNITPDFTAMNLRDLYLGRYSSAWYPFCGVMDEVRVYNRALTRAEVVALAQGSEQGYAETHPFALSQRSVTLAVGQSVTIDLLNGTGSYSVGSDTGIVDFTLDRENESITLTGIAEGTTNVTVIDVNTQTTILLHVTVTASQDETFTVNGVSFKMIAVEGGTFMMGAPDDDTEANADEKPAHQVTLSNYKIGETEVTQALWVAVMGSNPSFFKGDFNLPVESIKWNDIQLFIQKLNELTGREFRLPTEAEWEFAARGGNKGHGYKYSGSNILNDIAWWGGDGGSFWYGGYVGGNSEDHTHPVASKSPNELGIYDMSGNVWEWTQDWFGYYSDETQINPYGPISGSYIVTRGGCFNCNSKACRVTMRYQGPNPGAGGDGLRLAL